MHINIEFKASVADIAPYESKLLSLQPLLIGMDHQVDTYFNAPQGRLKLREGNIENALISYDREDAAAARQSSVILYPHAPHPAIKEILTHQLGIKVIVDKQRKIYFINNVKFHFDRVEGLGTFIEVEAIDYEGNFTAVQLQEQCDYYFNFFELDKSSLVDCSYSDLLLNKRPD